MARYTGPSTRVSRRFGQYIVGSPKVLERRNFPPASMAPKSPPQALRVRRRASPEQKLRFIYGLLERQFRRVFAIAKKDAGVTGERFLQLPRPVSTAWLSLGFARAAPPPASWSTTATCA